MLSYRFIKKASNWEQWIEVREWHSIGSKCEASCLSTGLPLDIGVGHQPATLPSVFGVEIWHKVSVPRND